MIQAHNRRVEEAKRGITRNDKGEIVNTPEWIAFRKQTLSTKQTEFLTRLLTIETLLEQELGIVIPKDQYMNRLRLYVYRLALRLADKLNPTRYR